LTCASTGSATENANNIHIYWHHGKLNYADYWTKHHPAAHDQSIRHEFITPMLVIKMLCLSHHNNAVPAA
jgi:hypothetical protein